jgi:hypothetical protein
MIFLSLISIVKIQPTKEKGKIKAIGSESGGFKRFEIKV